MLAMTQAALAQNDSIIDLGKMREFEPISNRMGYFVDYSRQILPNQIRLDQFVHLKGQSIFNFNQLRANYYMKLVFRNSLPYSDTLLLFVGKAIDFELFEFDSAGGIKSIYQDRLSLYSPVLMNNIPYARIYLPAGKEKIFILAPDIRFYNWKAFEPVLLKKSETVTFAIEHFLIPNRLFLLSTLLMLGIMLSIMVYTFTRYFRIGRREYLYYSLAALFFILYFSSRLLEIFLFSPGFHFFDVYRYHVLQIGGTIMYILFIMKFLEIKTHYPYLFKASRIIIIFLLAYLSVDLILSFSTSLYGMSYRIFNLIRIMILAATVSFSLFLLTLKNKLPNLIATGAICVSILAAVAMYVTIKDHQRYAPGMISGGALTLFMLGILMEMFFYVQAITYRNRLEELERMKAVELLQIENDRNELEKYKAILEARDKERNRIAQEMHDDIGSGLTSIRLLSEIAKARDQHKPMAEVEKISASANTLIEKMNEIIWSMNSKNDSLPNLIAYLRHQIVEYFEPFSLQLQIFTPEHVPEKEISGEMRRNIVLATKEALHNIVKHANASLVEIQIHAESDLQITIRDNGKGMLKKDIQVHNNGLRNMKDRMNAIGGSFTLSGESGTTVNLRIPLN